MATFDDDKVWSKLEEARQRVEQLPKALRLIWAAAPRWTLAWGILLFTQGLLPAASVYLTKILVDNLDAAMGGGLAWTNLEPVLIPGALMAAIFLAQELLGSVKGWVRTAQSEHLQDHVKALIHKKAAALDLEFYETPDYYDLLNRANSEAGGRSLSLLEGMGGLLQNAVTLIGVAALLIPYGLWVPALLLASTLPALYVVVRHKTLHHAWWERTTEDRRWTQYFDRMLTLRYTAPEVRLFGLAEPFQRAYRVLRKGLRKSRLALLKNQNIANLWAGLSSLVVIGGAMGWMGWRALQGTATIGDIALFYRAFDQGQGLMRSMLQGVGTIYTDTMFLDHLFQLMELEPTLEAPDDPVPLPRGSAYEITFENVGFQYPGSTEWALRDFNLEIPAGATIALVGPNGAGKSTVTKLLCRFYDPTEGRVRLDGTDLRRFDLEALRRHVTVMFQHPLRYIATAEDNIRMGDRDREAGMAAVERAAAAGGAAEIIERLPDEYDTLLGKHFSGGVELSGGQWQRVSLARAFFRQAPLVVLDEPTSFMDSWAEMRWLDRFCDLVDDRTALIVTHRFTTAMRADRIHVMHEGRIVEAGTHDELVAQGGRYAQSWQAQVNGRSSTSATADGDSDRDPWRLSEREGHEAGDGAA